MLNVPVHTGNTDVEMSTALFDWQTPKQMPVHSTACPAPKPNFGICT